MTTRVVEDLRSICLPPIFDRFEDIPQRLCLTRIAVADDASQQYSTNHTHNIIAIWLCIRVWADISVLCKVGIVMICASSHDRRGNAYRLHIPSIGIANHTMSISKTAFGSASIVPLMMMGAKLLTSH